MVATCPGSDSQVLATKKLSALLLLTTCNRGLQSLAGLVINPFLNRLKHLLIALGRPPRIACVVTTMADWNTSTSSSVNVILSFLTRRECVKGRVECKAWREAQLDPSIQPAFERLVVTDVGSTRDFVGAHMTVKELCEAPEWLRRQVLASTSECRTWSQALNSSLGARARGGVVGRWRSVSHIVRHHRGSGFDGLGCVLSGHIRVPYGPVWVCISVVHSYSSIE